jgi:hypothetical protein
MAKLWPLNEASFGGGKAALWNKPDESKTLFYIKS